MAIVYESLDSLPYVDADITQEERERANRLIRRELPSQAANEPHPSLPTLKPAQFSDLIQQQLNLHASDAPRTKGIDLTRYEAPDEPSADDSSLATHQAALRNAYTLSTYLSGRRTNLELLDEFGKNAWLIGNAELEALLKRLEAEATTIQQETDSVNRERKGAQERSGAELTALEESWRLGVGKIIEVQVATVQLRQELEKRRRDAVQ